MKINQSINKAFILFQNVYNVVKAPVVSNFIP